MIAILVLVNSLIFFAISGIHIYWALGGKWGSHSAIPANFKGEKLFLPGVFATVIVAAGLFLFALVTLGNLGIFDEYISRDYIHYADLGITAIFYLRAIGEFRYVGLFRKVKDTDFAKQDKKFFTPLCIFIGTVSLLIALLNR
ncbi:membrane protein [Leptospira kobayashii]|uniref:Membrane protein n=1 Tax=Leptospira kobayashii TaxID=1917830 RepID=A0ABM7UHI3_9LEPT|nr:DUF3995 domain-containing protein [Leptospira kobayashii]BDA78122.1 membrane protein [Leptospira kobayashii]